MARLFGILILALVSTAVGWRPLQAMPPGQGRLPGFGDYCPILVSPGDVVTFRVGVTNVSTTTAIATNVEIRLPPGLVVDEGSAKVVRGPGAGQFAPRVAASAAAGYVWASTAQNDTWTAFTLIVDARVSASAVGEQLAIALSWDAEGRQIRRIDGVVYARPRGPGVNPARVVVDMGVPEICRTEATPTSTPTPTPTPIPPPYFVTGAVTAEAEGAWFTVSSVCLVFPGGRAGRSAASEYTIDIESPASARVAFSFGPNADIAADGRAVRFVVRPGSPAGTEDVRVSAALRMEGGSPPPAAASAGVRVRASEVGDLGPGQASAPANCAADAGFMDAVRASEKARLSARTGAATPAAVAQSAPTTTVPAAPTRVEQTVTPTPPPPVAGTKLGPALAPTAGATDGPAPDGRAIVLPLTCGAGIVLAALALMLFLRRREEAG